jgi:hypothetical protein
MKKISLIGILVAICFGKFAFADWDTHDSSHLPKELVCNFNRTGNGATESKKLIVSSNKYEKTGKKVKNWWLQEVDEEVKIPFRTGSILFESTNSIPGRIILIQHNFINNNYVVQVRDAANPKKLLISTSFPGDQFFVSSTPENKINLQFADPEENVSINIGCDQIYY